MAGVVQNIVVNRLAYVAHWSLRIGWRNDFVGAGSVLIGSQDTNLPPRHLLFMNIHRLKEGERDSEKEMR